MVKIYCDTTSDLNQELIDRFQPTIIPLYVSLGDQSYRGTDITTSDLFEFVEKTGTLPKTSAPTVGDFTQTFSIPDDILYISLSSALSATFQNAILSLDLIDKKNIRLIDSKSLSTGIGLLVCAAAEYRDQGCTLDEIEEKIRAMIPNLRVSFVIETLDYLYKGGRCSALQNILSSLLSIRPVIEVRADGSLGVKAKTRGSRKKALTYLLDEFKKDLPAIDLHRIFITHTGCDEDAQFLKQSVLELCSPEEIHITNAGSIIASHCGPDTIGLLYVLKSQ
ncbi:MAG TPA: DegV family protein [Anaerolineaceae bacterium]